VNEGYRIDIVKNNTSLNEDPCSSVILRCQVDDIASSPWLQSGSEIAWLQSWLFLKQLPSIDFHSSTFDNWVQLIICRVIDQ
jgi:hypothetical protein